MSEAFADDVAAVLGKPMPSQAELDEFEAMKRLKALADQHHSDRGVAMLAGLWLGKGMPENEIISRLWPKQQRFHAVDNET